MAAAPNEIDAIVVDPTEDLASAFDAELDPSAEDDEPALARIDTKPLGGSLAGRVELDIADPDAAASFLELVARVIRTKARIVLIIE